MLEAICLKKLIISSNCPTGPREILNNGKGGLLFKSKNYKELAKKIVYFHKIHRQNNKEFQNALNYLRLGRVTNPIKKMLRSRKNVNLKNDYGILPTK